LHVLVNEVTNVVTCKQTHSEIQVNVNLYGYGIVVFWIADACISTDVSLSEVHSQNLFSNYSFELLSLNALILNVMFAEKFDCGYELL
jgi:hypothetical protein